MTNKERNKTKDKYEIGDLILDAFGVTVIAGGVFIIYTFGGIISYIVGGAMVLLAVQFIFPSFDWWDDR